MRDPLTWAQIISMVRAANFTLGEADALLSDNEDGAPILPDTIRNARAFPRPKWWFYNAAHHVPPCHPYRERYKGCTCGSVSPTAKVHAAIVETRRAYVPKIGA